MSHTKLTDDNVPGDLVEEMYQDPRIIIRFALDDANDIRRALAIGEGKLDALPAARLGESEDCVLARALSNGWKAGVDTARTTLTHSNSGMSYKQVALAVETLRQLGFDVEWDDYDWDQAPEGARSYSIDINHTWPMSQFVDWYDKGAYPELVLDTDRDGQEIVENFKKAIEAGASLKDISRVGPYSALLDIRRAADLEADEEAARAEAQTEA